MRELEKYIFLMGPFHSGNNWIQHWLSKHPKIFTGFESGIFPILSEIKNRFTNQPAMQIPAWYTNEDMASILRETAILLFSSCSVRKNNEPYLLEMSPKHAEYVELIYQLFPEGHFVFLHRDGRRAVASAKYRFKLRKSQWNIDDHIDRWIRQIKPLVENRLPTNSLVLKYLDICHEPAKAAQNICAYLGIKLHEDLIPWKETVNAQFATEWFCYIDNVYGMKEHGEYFWQDYLSESEKIACRKMYQFLEVLEYNIE